MAHTISIGSEYAYDQLDLETNERALCKRAASFYSSGFVKRTIAVIEVIDKILSFETRERYLFALEIS